MACISQCMGTINRITGHHNKEETSAQFQACCRCCEDQGRCKARTAAVIRVAWPVAVVGSYERCLSELFFWECSAFRDVQGVATGSRNDLATPRLPSGAASAVGALCNTCLTWGFLCWSALRLHFPNPGEAPLNDTVTFGYMFLELDSLWRVCRPASVAVVVVYRPGTGLHMDIPHASTPCRHISKYLR